MLGLKLNHVSKRGHWEQIKMKFRSEYMIFIQKWNGRYLVAASMCKFLLWKWNHANRLQSNHWLGSHMISRKRSIVFVITWRKDYDVKHHPGSVHNDCPCTCVNITRDYIKFPHFDKSCNNKLHRTFCVYCIHTLKAISNRLSPS